MILFIIYLFFFFLLLFYSFFIYVKITHSKILTKKKVSQSG